MEEFDAKYRKEMKEDSEWKPENIVARLVPSFTPNVVLKDGILARVYTHHGRWGIITKTREEPCMLDLHQLATWLNDNDARPI